MIKQIYENIETLISKLSPKLVNKLIYSIDQNTYVLFEKYHLIKNQDFYQIERKTDYTTHKFYQVKNAVAWVILDQHNKISEARRVLELDKKLESIKSEALLHKKLQINGSTEKREINRDKLSHDLQKQKRFQWELDKYIILANTCQQRGYENELTRIARK